ncbi:MAG: hypothetical protein R6W81_03680 [Bacteroidales bacterium]
MYTEEELFELMASAKRFEREHSVPIDSAMQTDVPGYSWGLCAALAANGVHYLSLGPNAGHRIGHTYHWGDRPFYWYEVIADPCLFPLGTDCNRADKMLRLHTCTNIRELGEAKSAPTICQIQIFFSQNLLLSISCRMFATLVVNP